MIYPKQGADISQAADFIKSVVNTEDLLPWTDIHEKLVSWTVEASPDEIDRLQSYGGIGQVTELSLPHVGGGETSPAAAGEPAAASDGEGLAARQEKAAEPAAYLIFAKDPVNKGEIATTEAALKKLLGKVRPVYFEEELFWWSTRITSYQADEARKLPGVLAADPDVEMDPNFIASPLPASPL
jgi:hypothetical protein